MVAVTKGCGDAIGDSGWWPLMSGSGADCCSGNEILGDVTKDDGRG